MRAKICSILAAASLSILPAAGQATVVTVSVQPSAATVHVGDTFTVNLVADIPSPATHWGLDLASPATLVSQTAAPTIGPSWTPAPTTDGDGLAGFAPLLSTVSGSNVLLASISFQAIGAGTALFTPGVTAGDATEGFTLSPEGAADLVFNTATVAINGAVPEPPTAWLLLAGLLAAAGARKASRRRGRYPQREAGA